MDIIELMKQRHSVRQYLDKPIPAEIRTQLDSYVTELNKESKLNIQIIYDEPNCFNSFMAHYGKFSGVSNYIAIVGKKEKDLEEKAGYYGEKLVLKAQELGLNTCWVALTHGKSKSVINADEKEVIIISLGYGANDGNPHKSKRITDLSDLKDNDPEWFKRGVEAALLAPTAINQQKFYIARDGNKVSLSVRGIGTNTRIDLGIVRCHFELGAGKDNFSWVE